MTKEQNSERLNRQSSRLKDYDYSQPGAYFITICTKNKESLFGEIVDGEMVLNRFGIIVNEEWLRTPELRGNVEIDTYTIMPNHFHGIIVINQGRGVLCNTPLRERYVHRHKPSAPLFAGSNPPRPNASTSYAIRRAHASGNATTTNT